MDPIVVGSPIRVGRGCTGNESLRAGVKGVNDGSFLGNPVLHLVGHSMTSIPSPCERLLAFEGAGFSNPRQTGADLAYGQAGHLSELSGGQPRRFRFE